MNMMYCILTRHTTTTTKRTLSFHLSRLLLFFDIANKVFTQTKLHQFVFASKKQNLFLVVVSVDDDDDDDGQPPEPPAPPLVPFFNLLLRPTKLGD
jgi:hypothetical protein